MKVVVLHPTGNRNVRAVLTGLNKAKMLLEFNTTLVINPNSILLKLLPAKIKQELLRRTYLHIDSRLIISHFSRELTRMISIKLGLSWFTKPETGWASIDAIYHDLDHKVAQRLNDKHSSHIDGVYAYEDGALECFKVAKQAGIRCIYELPIAYWQTGRDLMQEEALRNPGWEITLGGGTRDSLAKLERKTKELELADVVIVSSSFVKDSLPQWAKNKKIIMSPFGSPEAPETNQAGVPEAKAVSAKRLRVLFVGSMGQRKGLCDLFDAVKVLNNEEIELVVMGSLLAPMDFYRSEFAGFTYEPGRSHEQVLALMRSCDVFCLPSIVEGRALVMQEAMSQGLPIIVTPNTGGSDLVIEGETGFLVPIRSPERIADRLRWFISNQEKIPQMGEMAKIHAATYTWENYASTIVNEIKKL
jgi:glycosyltransferase involved in cell wall biosynthesis